VLNEPSLLVGSVLEIVPIAEFTGKFGWGYDGVCLFAPSALYGELNEAKRFIAESQPPRSLQTSQDIEAALGLNNPQRESVCCQAIK
jgi:hypothetical protein